MAKTIIKNQFVKVAGENFYVDSCVVETSQQLEVIDIVENSLSVDNLTSDIIDTNLNEMVRFDLENLTVIHFSGEPRTTASDRSVNELIEKGKLIITDIDEI